MRHLVVLMMVTMVKAKAINLQSHLGGKVEILAGSSQKEYMFWLSTLAAALLYVSTVLVC